MAVEWVKPAKRGSGVSLKRDKKNIQIDADLSFLVRCNSQDTDPLAIAYAPGIDIFNPHPAIPGLVCSDISAKPTGNTGLLWQVTAKFQPPEPQDGNDDNNSDELGLPADVWTAGGSSKSVPVFRDIAGNIITNTAGDPLEGLEKEEPEYTLNLSRPVATHGTWLSIAASHVDHVNDATWTGGPPETWLCRFRSAQLEVKANSLGVLLYWMTQWEFAYKASTWRLKPWNVGFHELPNGDWSPGAWSASTAERRAILGVDKKPVKSPVALDAQGRAKPAGQPPDVMIGFDGNEGIQVHPLADFSVFGEISTPGA